MQKITPYLWFDKEAKEAAEFYTTVFGDASKVKNVNTISNTPSGDVDIVSFELFGHSFMAMSAGPMFTINPSISFIVGCETKEEVDTLWKKLSEGGKALMELGSYPFSERYGWVEDKYGVSWQLIFTKPEGDERPRIVSSLMFTQDNVGKAEEAIHFYVSVFRNAKIGNILHFGADDGGGKEGTVMFADFKLDDVWFAAMDGAGPHDFTFNEAVSLMVHCDTQEEIDHLWKKLSAVPESEQCGWLKDKFGVSWQIVPRVLDELLASKDKKAVARVTKAFLKMKKFDIAKLQETARG